jgi:tRNA(Leu) C34 or U34 (ribose-2'-O)-methylase TrmL
MREKALRDPSESLWREALGRLRALDQAWGEPAARQRERHTCQEWMAAQTALPRLAHLARLLAPDFTRQQLWCALVPVEREVARCKITDVDILDSDLPPALPRHAPLLPLTVVADSLRSAFNLGGLFRTAECFGVSEVVLCGYTPVPELPQAARAALGAEKLVPWRQVEDIREALAGLKAAGARCLALETVSGAPDIAEFAWPFPCALVLGNERFGLDAGVLAACDGIVRIPLYGRKNSLNVVSAFAVAAHEIRRQFERTYLEARTEKSQGIL